MQAGHRLPKSSRLILALHYLFCSGFERAKITDKILMFLSIYPLDSLNKAFIG